MGLIQLSKPGLFTVVDDADHARVNEYLWCPMKGSHGNVYAGIEKAARSILDLTLYVEDAREHEEWVAAKHALHAALEDK